MRGRYSHVLFYTFTTSITFAAVGITSSLDPLKKVQCRFVSSGMQCDVMLRKSERASGVAGSVDRWLVQLRRTRRNPNRMDESSFHQLFLSASNQNSAHSRFVFMAGQKYCIMENKPFNNKIFQVLLNLDTEARKDFWSGKSSEQCSLESEIFIRIRH